MRALASFFGNLAIRERWRVGIAKSERKLAMVRGTGRYIAR
jgi:hypothetical protein